MILYDNPIIYHDFCHDIFWIFMIFVIFMINVNRLMLAIDDS